MVFPYLAFAELGQHDIPLFKPRRLGLGIEMQSFKSTANYTDAGRRAELPTGYEFQTYDVLLSTTFDASDDWAYSLDLSLAYAESFNLADRRNSRRVRDIKFGAYRLFELDKKKFFVIDAFYLQNFISNKISSDKVSIGDGVFWAQLGIWWHHELNTYLEYNAYSGFRQRGGGLSSLFIYKFSPQIKLKKFALGFEFAGYSTVIESSAEDNLENQVINQEYNALSQRYNSNNPHLEELLLWAGYEFEPLTYLNFGVNKVLGLENTADGFGFYLEMKSSFLITDSGLSFPYFLQSTQRRKSNQKKVRLKNNGVDAKDLNTPEKSELEDL